MTESKENFSEEDATKEIQAEKLQMEDLIVQMRKESDAGRPLPDDLVEQLRKKVSAARSLLEGPRMGLENWFIVKTKRFIEEAEEKLAKSQEPIVLEQVEKTYRELLEGLAKSDLKLKEYAETILKSAGKPPEEFALKDLEKIARRKQEEEKKAISSGAFGATAPDELPKQSFESPELFALPHEFRKSPKQFELYLLWLDDTERIYRNQSIAVESLSPEDQKSYAKTIQEAGMILKKLQNEFELTDMFVIEMASVVNSTIRLLKKLGVPISQLTHGAFMLWLNTKRKNQEA